MMPPSWILLQTAIAISVFWAVAGPKLFPHAPSLLTLSMVGLPTIIFMAIVCLYPTKESSRYRWGLLVAFFFSLLGGAFLGAPGCFVLGVFGFLFANLAYLTAFSSDVGFAKKAAPFVVCGLLGVGILIFAWGNIGGGYRIPLALYCLTIVSVPAQGITRHLVLRREGTFWAAMGTPLLLISDAAIAVNMFMLGPKSSWKSCVDLFIMITYLGGQWLIVMSLIKAKPKSSFPSFRQLP